MYQFLQFNKHQKIREISRHFSALFRRKRKVKSRCESNFHRYTLLTFMTSTFVTGGVVSYYGALQVVKAAALH